MKRQIVLPSLLASSSALYAGLCCDPCSEPTCCPTPTECIQGVAYTVPFHDLDCYSGVSIDAEFLYWYARETDLSFGAVVKNKPHNPNATGAFSPAALAIQKYEYLETKWDPGYRVGLGWNSSCDGWDINLNYTWMRNTKTNSASEPFNTVNLGLMDRALINPWINGSFSSFQVGIFTSLRLFDLIQASWELCWNQIDLDLGRKYWLSQCFNFRPHAGIRGGWWKTQFQTTSTHTFDAVPNFNLAGGYTFEDRFTSKIWGVGLLAGIEPTWYFTCDFALFGKVDFSLLWGESSITKNENYTQSNSNTQSAGASNGFTFTNATKENFSQMTPIFDLAIGFRWEPTWCCDRFRSTLDFGWEHHLYYDQNNRIKTSDNTFHYSEEQGNLGMGVLLIRLRFDF